jgi:putative DNA primase/helicase
MTEPLKERCQGRWPSILAQLGVSAAFLVGKHTPCPMCGGKDRFRFDNKGGNGSYICSHCGAGDGVKLLMGVNGWDFREAASRVDEVLGTAVETPAKPERSEDEKREAMNRLWRGSGPIVSGDPVWRYLNSRTGLTALPACLRTAARCRYNAEPPSFHPAMIAMMKDAHGLPAILHRTYLTKEGQKAPVEDVRRIMSGRVPKGSAVRLAEYTDTLGIAEGIETALSATKLFDVPCWAALTAGFMAEWIPPEDVKRIVIFADNDVSYTGQAAAFGLAKRLRSKGLTVEVEIPTQPDTDWNNVLSKMETAA